MNIIEALRDAVYRYELDGDPSPIGRAIAFYPREWTPEVGVYLGHYLVVSVNRIPDRGSTSFRGRPIGLYIHVGDGAWALAGDIMPGGRWTVTEVSVSLGIPVGTPFAKPKPTIPPRPIDPEPLRARDILD